MTFNIPPAVRLYPRLIPADAQLLLFIYFFWGGLILTFCIIVFPRILYNETSVNNVTQFHLLATEKLLESLERKQMEYIFSVPVNLRDFPMRNYRSLFFLLYLYSDIWLKAENKNSRFPWQLLENPGLWAMMAGVVFRSMVILQGLLGTQQLSWLQANQMSPLEPLGRKGKRLAVGERDRCVKDSQRCLSLLRMLSGYADNTETLVRPTYVSSLQLLPSNSSHPVKQWQELNP